MPTKLFFAELSFTYDNTKLEEVLREHGIQYESIRVWKQSIHHLTTTPQPPAAPPRGLLAGARVHHDGNAKCRRGGHRLPERAGARWAQAEV